MLGNNDDWDSKDNVNCYFEASNVHGNDHNDNLHTSQQQCGSHLVQLFLNQDNIYRKTPRKKISFGKIGLIIS